MKISRHSPTSPPVVRNASMSNGFIARKPIDTRAPAMWSNPLVCAHVNSLQHGGQTTPIRCLLGGKALWSHAASRDITPL